MPPLRGSAQNPRDKPRRSPHRQPGNCPTALLLGDQVEPPAPPAVAMAAIQPSGRSRSTAMSRATLTTVPRHHKRAHQLSSTLRYPSPHNPHHHGHSPPTPNNPPLPSAQRPPPVTPSQIPLRRIARRLGSRQLRTARIGHRARPGVVVLGITSGCERIAAHRGPSDGLDLGRQHGVADDDLRIRRRGRARAPRPAQVERVMSGGAGHRAGVDEEPVRHGLVRRGCGEVAVRAAGGGAPVHELDRVLVEHRVESPKMKSTSPSM